ncbi:hypothetical protein B0J18DRAFT_77352 [Chaetomium sp. MPI-SDFR-AT-0129]|nr:hypothetical protein B0J18DRAFT_77352 [Chaetomium sp. MPI-SDFR-AT-0129]
MRPRRALDLDFDALGSISSDTRPSTWDSRTYIGFGDDTGTKTTTSAGAGLGAGLDDEYRSRVSVGGRRSLGGVLGLGAASVIGYGGSGGSGSLGDEEDYVFRSRARSKPRSRTKSRLGLGWDLDSGLDLDRDLNRDRDRDRDREREARQAYALERAGMIAARKERRKQMEKDGGYLVRSHEPPPELQRERDYPRLKQHHSYSHPDEYDRGSPAPAPSRPVLKSSVSAGVTEMEMEMEMEMGGVETDTEKLKSRLGMVDRTETSGSGGHEHRSSHRRHQSKSSSRHHRHEQDTQDYPPPTDYPYVVLDNTTSYSNSRNHRARSPSSYPPTTSAAPRTKSRSHPRHDWPASDSNTHSGSDDDGTTDCDFTDSDSSAPRPPPPEYGTSPVKSAAALDDEGRGRRRRKSEKRENERLENERLVDAHRDAWGVPPRVPGPPVLAGRSGDGLDDDGIAVIDMDEEEAEMRKREMELEREMRERERQEDEYGRKKKTKTKTRSKSEGSSKSGSGSSRSEREERSEKRKSGRTKHHHAGDELAGEGIYFRPERPTRPPGLLATATAAYDSQSGSGRSQSRLRSDHRERDREREMYEEYHWSSREGNEKETRFAFPDEARDEPEPTLPNPRVPSTAARRRRRSESYETRRNGVSPVVMARANSKFRTPKPQYAQVHALILTWSFHDLRAETYTAPPAADYVSLEQETARLRTCLQNYGYIVHEYLIPMEHSVESLKNELRRFCRFAADDTLLMVYYHGHGAMDNNELIFSSHDHPENPEWSKTAAAELYAAFLDGNACAIHSARVERYHELRKKYERYRPVSTVPWDAIRSPLLSAPCDLLLVLDCCAAGGAGLRHLNWQPPPGAECYTKHLFAACGFESSTNDDMTAAMCSVLDEWVPPALPPAGTAAKSASRSRSRSTSTSHDSEDNDKKTKQTGGGTPGPVGAGQYLTTKRLHQLMEDKLQKGPAGSQPIFKQLLPQDPEQYITLPNLAAAAAAAAAGGKDVRDVREVKGGLGKGKVGGAVRKKAVVIEEGLGGAERRGRGYVLA